MFFNNCKHESCSYRRSQCSVFLVRVSLPAKLPHSRNRIRIRDGEIEEDDF